MFRCDECGKLSQPNETCIRAFTRIRQVTYIHEHVRTQGHEPISEQCFHVICSPTITPMVDNRITKVVNVPRPLVCQRGSRGNDE